MDDLIKKLTGKNKGEYEQAARHLIDSGDVELFKALVEKDAFLFDFIKQNVANRLAEAVNDNNWRNLTQFLSVYSPSYEEFIVTALVNYADESMTDDMLERLEHGTLAQKTYAAKYFSFINDPLAIPLLRENAYCENENLARNTAQALAALEDEECYHDALQKLQSNDEFEKLEAAKFLTAYGNKDAIPAIIEAMKNSSMAENIAGEIPYLDNLFNLLEADTQDALLVINNIINGLGEILGLSVVLDFELYEVFQLLIEKKAAGKAALVLLNAQDKFETLTENDEYLFDEDKDTQGEVYDIKKLLNGVNKKDLRKHVNAELDEHNPFIYTALEFADDIYAIRELLKSDNQTLILKTAEVLKSLNNLDESAKTVAMLKVTDGNIKSIIRAL